MNLYMDESRPSSLQLKLSTARKEGRARIASKAVKDTPIRLKKATATKPSNLAAVALQSISTPLSMAIRSAQRDWIWIRKPSDVVMTYPPDILHTIMMVCCREFGITLLEMRCRRRTQNLVLPRHMAMYLCRELTTKSLPEICRQFDGRDHTVALHACNKLTRLVMTDSFVCQTAAQLKEELWTYMENWRGVELARKL